ncbi:MAG: hypothetical protein ACRD68_09685 [Pyrinomonadaceae bacterium]
MRVILDLDEKTVERLRVLGEPAEVLARLADHAQQGVYRPGSWERPWLEQVFFANEWQQKLEQDPEAPYFERPRSPFDAGTVNCSSCGLYFHLPEETQPSAVVACPECGSKSTARR